MNRNEKMRNEIEEEALKAVFPNFKPELRHKRLPKVYSDGAFEQNHEID